MTDSLHLKPENEIKQGIVYWFDGGLVYLSSPGCLLLSANPSKVTIHVGKASKVVHNLNQESSKWPDGS